MVHVADVTLRWSLCGLLDLKQCTIVSTDCAALENGLNNFFWFVNESK